jgi:hypothetical protein
LAERSFCATLACRLASSVARWRAAAACFSTAAAWFIGASGSSSAAAGFHVVAFTEP